MNCIFERIHTFQTILRRPEHGTQKHVSYTRLHVTCTVFGQTSESGTEWRRGLCFGGSEMIRTAGCLHRKRRTEACLLLEVVESTFC